MPEVQQPVVGPAETKDESVEYRDVPGFPGYRVGSDGTVWSFRSSASWRKLKPCPNSRGYLSVTLCSGTRKDKHTQRVNRLVLLAFSGIRPDGKEAAHLDGNKSNNRISNLAWKTHTENIADKKRHGTYTCGECHHKAILADADVLAILEIIGKGNMTQRKIAFAYGVSESLVSKLKLRKFRTKGYQ